MKPITVPAFAKVNLYLNVLSKRKDGYHNIATVFHKISLHDTITVGLLATKAIEISCRSPYLPHAKANLAYKAAVLMQKSFHLPCGVRIKIAKRVPVAAGLGGGSSDAASVILVMKRLFNLKPSAKQLIAIAKEIGADVPFFVSGYNCAIGKGIGERLNQIKSRRFYYILILIPRSLRIYTKTIYGRIKLPLTRLSHNANMLAHTLSCRRIDNIGRLLYNRLEEVVLPDNPIVIEAKNLLSSYATEGVLLSGSGPAVFGLFNRRKEAMQARDAIGRDSRWCLFLAQTM